MSETEWKGDERRGIQIHILNYVDERLKAHIERVEKLFTAHTADESVRYDAILTTMHQNREKTASEISDLSRQISVYTVRTEELRKAFLENEHGEPDVDGHRYDHGARKKLGEWWDGIKDKTLTKLIEWGSLAFVIWAVHSMWEAFLKGPGK